MAINNIFMSAGIVAIMSVGFFATGSILYQVATDNYLDADEKFWSVAGLEEEALDEMRSAMRSQSLSIVMGDIGFLLAFITLLLIAFGLALRPPHFVVQRERPVTPQPPNEHPKF